MGRHAPLVRLNRIGRENNRINDRNNGPSPQNNRGGWVREQIKLEVPKRWVTTEGDRLVYSFLLSNLAFNGSEAAGGLTLVNIRTTSFTQRNSTERSVSKRCHIQPCFHLFLEKNAPEFFRARNAIFSSSVSKNREVYNFTRLKLLVWRELLFILRISCELPDL